jgi:hypothetical protein
MATKYTSLIQERKEVKKTVFNKIVNSKLEIEEAISTPEQYNNVLYLGKDKDYGDVFKAWDNNTDENFTIFFGVKGDEF